MKKSIVLIFTMFFLTTTAFGANCEVNCVEPYDLSSSISRFFSSITGQNFIAEKIGQSIIKKSIKKNIYSGDIKTNIESFSTKDLKAGRFKSMKITGKDVNVQGVHITSFSAKTLCDFNYITEGKNGDIIVKEDMPLNISVVMTEDDINKTMESSDYKRMVNNINSIGGNFNIFSIESSTVKIKDEKMYYTIKYSIPFVRKSREITICAGLKVENGQIKLTNTKIENSTYSVDLNKFSTILNYINPLDFSAKILENKEAKFHIDNVNLADNKITIGGTIVILKDKI